MNEYFLHGKAFIENGGYREISLVVRAIGATEAHDNAQGKVMREVSGAKSVVFDVMSKV